MRAAGSNRSLLIVCCGLAAALYYFWNSLHGLKQLADPEVVEDEHELDVSSALIDVPLPQVSFPKYAEYPAHNSKNPKGYAYATLLCTHDPNERDPFFIAAQQIVWRILWSDWHSQYPIIVFVCPSTPSYQRRILAGQGAIIEEIELITVSDPSKLHLSRWRDQLTKLNMWKYTDYKRITFLDVDAFPVQNMDDIFDVVPTQECIRSKLNAEDKKVMEDPAAGRELCGYTFGGTVMSENDGAYLNGGVFVFAPSRVWHAKLMRDLEKTDQYDVQTAEQGLLDSVLGFSKRGPFPRHDFSQNYNADGQFYLDHNERGTIKVIHCKMWSPLSLTHAPELNIRWDVDWMSMARFYDSDIFALARQTGHRKEPLEVLGEMAEKAEAKKRRKKKGGHHK
ncbi:protein of unknown function [Taphrina deformans PYCC 5710]|uniref:Glycosyl transferase family 8 protein n=1 Tax=Taphrina deformans (strain PYCC 5710 / ATCC 11124 / CBS 356.35 / IMI 108563 / JCM 9778 / NBRC 8474) TaxID=1097556 RepID=R4XGD1_TAPDE|nr:protein of unknown function [Taphrina deformans PYCC 5710]|eukprot:CCG84692.1 protein of unknown function [Taphrina deformans PYCC 5710]